MPTTLPARRHDLSGGGPLVVFLHWLGGDARSWDLVAEGLAARGFSCAALDLPGFGEANADVRFEVGAMADAVMTTVETLDTREHGRGAGWLLVGHSMGGKVAAVVARAAAAGRSR